MDAKQIKLATSTPMLSHWYSIRKNLDDEIVFCRVGDFYELFFDDAERAAKILDLQLTRRKVGDSTYQMAGVPVRSLNNYVARLVEKGYKVAIIDQLEDAKQAKGIVKRGLTRIITPGTIVEETMLNPDKNNYLAAICHRKMGKSVEYGIAVCDLSTGDFRAGSFFDEDRTELLRVYTRFSPVEFLYMENVSDLTETYHLPFDNDELLTPKPEYWFDPKQVKELVYQQFNVKTVKGFGLQEDSMAVGAAGAIIRYIRETQFASFSHVSAITSFDIHDTMVLDSTAIKSLELFENLQDHTSHATLLELMDETSTPMGSRLLRHWIANPLANKQKIEERLEAVTLFSDSPLIMHRVRAILSEMGDIERLMTRISMGSAKPDELIKLAMTLEKVPSLREILDPLQSYFPRGLIEQIDPAEDLVHLIRKTIRDNPSTEVGSGSVIKEGFNTELDHLRAILSKGETWLDEYIQQEKAAHNLQSMKIKQNNHLGYFIEISKKELNKVPDHYIQKQVMVNYSRFFTEKLKNWETEILEAELKILELEQALYQNLLKELSKFVSNLQVTGQCIAQVDCLSAFAYLAERRNYCRPMFVDNNSLKIYQGRHPVIEALNPDQDYVPNDVLFDYDTQRVLIITGPNFSGKSSLLRATALITIMAHMGAFVPAEKVELGITDRIFTRIGASDNLVAGQSTFMVEMIDAANLVNNSTERSLVIADELGRGTSTYDGLAIAWSIIEYLHNKKGSPKTMIATHYHQLSELEEMLPAVKNYQFVIRFENEQPIFDHKLEKGASDKSFGVEIAKLAGLPREVVKRGRQILKLLEDNASEVNAGGPSGRKLAELIIAEDGQSSLENWFEMNRQEQPRSSEQELHPVLKELQEVDLNSLTPIQALQILAKLKELANSD